MHTFIKYIKFIRLLYYALYLPLFIKICNVFFIYLFIVVEVDVVVVIIIVIIIIIIIAVLLPVVFHSIVIEFIWHAK